MICVGGAYCGAKYERRGPLGEHNGTFWNFEILPVLEGTSNLKECLLLTFESPVTSERGNIFNF